MIPKFEALPTGGQYWMIYTMLYTCMVVHSAIICNFKVLPSQLLPLDNICYYLGSWNATEKKSWHGCEIDWF